MTNASSARQVFALLFDDPRPLAQIVDEGGYRQVSDASQLEALVDQVLAAHPEPVADFRAGKTQALGFLIGQAMRAADGKADPKLLRQLLTARLRGQTTDDGG